MTAMATTAMATRTRRALSSGLSFATDNGTLVNQQRDRRFVIRPGQPQYGAVMVSCSYAGRLRTALSASSRRFVICGV